MTKYTVELGYPLTVFVDHQFLVNICMNTNYACNQSPVYTVAIINQQGSDYVVNNMYPGNLRTGEIYLQF